MFNLKAPCANCPFLKEGGIRVTSARTKEIAHYFLDTRGGSFPCHKTVDYDEEEEDGEARPMRADEQMCVGGMLFAHKQGRANQMVRIAERIGDFNLDNLSGIERVFVLSKRC